MKLLIRGPLELARVDFVKARLTTPWTVRVVQPDEPNGTFSQELMDADAVVSMFWPGEGLAPKLRLLQLPGAGLDQVNFDALPPDCQICNVYEHEIGIAEFIVLGILEHEIKLRHLDRAPT